MLSGNGVDEQVLYRDTEPFRPQWEIFQFGYHRADISQIEIRVWGKGPESCPDALYWVAESVAGQADHLMAFGDQDTSNRKQRIEMACCRSRRKENFHVNLSL
jgi:hypothetical protein